MSEAANRSAFVVAVEFRIRSGSEAAFLALVSENARRSLTEEEGCRQFDVVQPGDAPDRVFLYEVYDGPEAFEAHQRTPHFLEFDDASAQYVEAKVITTGLRVFP